MEFFKSSKLICNKTIAMRLYCGLVSDSNRFLFDSSSYKTFALVSYYLKNINLLYQMFIKIFILDL